MYYLVALTAALLVALAAGGNPRFWARTELRAEPLLILALALQPILPLAVAAGASVLLVRCVWLSAFPVLLLVLVLNRRHAGIGLMAAGVASNTAVVFANLGMPVLADAIAIAVPNVSPAAYLDVVHPLATGRTVFLSLADIMPVVGPSWLAAVVSVGDLLLLVGLFVFLVSSACPSPCDRSHAAASIDSCQRLSETDPPSVWN